MKKNQLTLLFLTIHNQDLPSSPPQKINSDSLDVIPKWLSPTKVVSRAITTIGKDPIDTARGPTFMSTRNHNKQIGDKPPTNPAAQM